MMLFNSHRQGFKCHREGLLLLGLVDTVIGAQNPLTEFKCLHAGLILPLFGEREMDIPNIVRMIMYLLGLFWIFLGVAIISDVFMSGIERITSSKRRTKTKDGRTITVYVWNATVANLTLMALGSSAPEILLSLVEITLGDFFQGPLGAGTIVGSAAFNLLIISAVCVTAFPDGEVRYIKEVPVYAVTASCSVFAYMWLMFILMVSSPDVCEVWEGCVTLLMCPALVFFAYLADRGHFGGVALPKVQSQETIPNDATEDELAAIDAAIRKEHGDNLTTEQVLKIMQVQYFNKNSRAFYRRAAMDANIHGKKVDMTAVPTPEMVLGKVKSTVGNEKFVTIGHACEKYAVLENCGKAKVTLFRAGDLDTKASVKWSTKDGTAKAPGDYEQVDNAIATFDKGQDTVVIEIVINDDDAFEGDESFFINLTEPSVEDPSTHAVYLANDHSSAELTIIDDDLPGDLRFKTETAAFHEDLQDMEQRVIVQRYNGSTGKIGCKYHFEGMEAVETSDFEGTKGDLSFEAGQLSASIPFVIKAKGRTHQKGFNVVIEEPTEGTKFDASTDGNEEKCICYVVIHPRDEAHQQKKRFGSMKEKIHIANSGLGRKHWGQQFSDALFQIGDGGDEESNGTPEPTPLSAYVIHIVSVPWKLLFAFVPPCDYCGGWACFCGALVMIAVVTAIVGDMANLVGCTLDILPETAAISFVALGTSLPDTFASKTAAVMDPYADASIGNITGSNSVNVFLGIGLSWTVAAFYWTYGGQTAQWRSKRDYYGRNSPDVLKNINAAAGDGAVFMAPAGSLWFNLAVFSVNALGALWHLFARRRKHGGELGGPKKGLFGQYFTGICLTTQWLIYLAASITFARMGDPVTYTDIAMMPE